MATEVESVMTEPPSGERALRFFSKPDLPRITLFRHKTSSWFNPQASIGAQIDTGTKRMRGSKAWFARGPAHDVFENQLRRALESLLANGGLSEGAELFLRDYMIGPAEDLAVPMVMICCANKRLRREAESCVRQSGLLKTHGFKLMAGPLCLEAKTIPIRCMMRSKSFEHTSNLRETRRSDFELEDVLLDFGDLGHSLDLAYPDSRLSSLDYSGLRDSGQLVGRRLHYTADGAKSLGTATGGPIIGVGGSLYQLTVFHLFERQPQVDALVSNLDDDLDEICFFDDAEDEYGGQDEGDVLMTSRGSMTPSDQADQETDTSLFNMASPLGTTNSPSPRTKSQEQQPSVSRARTEHRPRFVRKSDLHQFYASRRLDYLLFPLGPAVSKIQANDVELPRGSSIKSLKIKELGEIGPEEERPVVAVTASSGPLTGTLVPGAVPYRPATGGPFQMVFAVKLDGIISKGDCGAAVIDGTTGNLYGHIVLGAPGTSLAYIAPASEIFNDIIRQSGAAASLDIQVVHSLSALEDDPTCMTRYSSNHSATTAYSGISSTAIGEKPARTLTPQTSTESLMARIKESEFSKPSDSPSLKSPKRAATDRGKSYYTRPLHPKVHCQLCSEFPGGFRGEHELRRHMEARHGGFIKKWICRDPQTAGIPSTIQAVNSLDKCKQCTAGKQYGAYYNAAAHLRRTHFKPKPPRKKPGKSDASDDKRGGRGGSDWPPMSELKLWMEEIHVSAEPPDLDEDEEGGTDLADAVDISFHPDPYLGLDAVDADMDMSSGNFGVCPVPAGGLGTPVETVPIVNWAFDFPGGELSSWDIPPEQGSSGSVHVGCPPGSVYEIEDDDQYGLL